LYRRIKASIPEVLMPGCTRVISAELAAEIRRLLADHRS